MFVKSLMIPKHNCFIIQQDQSLKTALEKLETHQIDGLPVLDGDQYVGIVTRYSIYEQYFLSNKPREEFLDDTTVHDIANNGDKFLEGEEAFEKTLLELKDFPLMAVVDSGKKFLGVITRSDVLEQFQSAFGVNLPGVRIAVTTVETEGRIARLSEIAHHYQMHIISLVTFDETDKLVRRIVVKVEQNDNIARFTKKLEEYGFRILSIKED